MQNLAKAEILDITLFQARFELLKSLLEADFLEQLEVQLTAAERSTSLQEVGAAAFIRLRLIERDFQTTGYRESRVNEILTMLKKIYIAFGEFSEEFEKARLIACNHLALSPVKDVSLRARETLFKLRPSTDDAILLASLYSADGMIQKSLEILQTAAATTPDLVVDEKLVKAISAVKAVLGA